MSALTLKVRARGQQMAISLGNKIKEHIEENMHTGRTVTGAKMIPLSPKWVKKKGHAIPYLWKGLMYRSVRDKVIKNGVEIYISDMGNNRAFIASILNVRRPFFGVSPVNLKKFIQEVKEEKF